MTTMIPAAEVDLSTKRLRLFYVSQLNQARLDHQLAPVLSEVEHLPALERAAVRGLFVAAKHALRIDVQAHPSHLLLLLIHLIDDRTFDALWSDYGQLLQWCGRDLPAAPQPIIDAIAVVEHALRSDPAGGPTHVDGGDDGIGQDDLQQVITVTGPRPPADSDSGHQGR